MEPRESVRLAWRSVRSHALRSSLTTLGVIIGVAAVITLATLGTSLEADILGQVGSDRATNIYVWTAPPGGEGRPGAGAEPVFTDRDLAELRALEGVADVIPQAAIPTTAIGFRNSTVARSHIVTTSPGGIESEAFAAGRPFEPGEREVVMNPLAATMFEENVSIGDEVTIQFAGGEETTATVVGILDRSTGTSPFERFDTRARLYVPTDPFYDATVESPTTGDNVHVYPLVTVVADHPGQVESVQTNTRTYLENDSDATQLKPEAYTFEVHTDEELVDQLRDLIDTMTRFVTGIAVISLIVGAIGIANIMLVSVTERTREIGIMKAVGAQSRDILTLFLVEAVLLGTLGSILGTLVGILGGYVAVEYVDLPLVLAVEWFAVAIVVGIIVGVVAGLYPAWRAARVDPIEALRHE